jgi:hypothetical protein
VLWSCNQRRDDVSGDVGQAVIAALEAVGEFELVEAEEVEEGGVEVVDGDGVLGDGPADVVGGAVG